MNFVKNIKSGKTLASEAELRMKAGMSFCLLNFDLRGSGALIGQYGLDLFLQLLEAIKFRLAKSFGEDICFHSEGADDFYLILGSDAETRRAEENLKIVFRDPIELPSLPSISVSIATGISRFPEDASSPKQLIQAAALALTEAKRQNQKEILA